jgi:hypothetical protein
MADIINLNRVRKERAKAAKAAEATENRRRHGRSKAEKVVTLANADRQRRGLDGHRRDPDDA